MIEMFRLFKPFFYIILFAETPGMLMEDKTLGDVIGYGLVIFLIPLFTNQLRRLYNEVILPLEFILVPTIIILLYHSCDDALSVIMFTFGIVLFVLGIVYRKERDPEQWKI